MSKLSTLFLLICGLDNGGHFRLVAFAFGSVAALVGIGAVALFGATGLAALGIATVASIAFGAIFFPVRKWGLEYVTQKAQ